jgi:thioredoxin 1|tara:strand:- start:413 stop:793 length:381 start_codon:yes stop_codon:yes gene_type:complete
MKLTKENFETTLKDNRLVLVDFWAEWCGPCRMLNPIMKNIEDKYKGKVVIGKVNADEELDLSVKFSVRSIPTVLIVKDGEVVERFAGAGPERMYIEKLEYYLKGVELSETKEEPKSEEKQVVEEKK